MRPSVRVRRLVALPLLAASAFAQEAPPKGPAGAARDEVPDVRRRLVERLAESRVRRGADVGDGAPAPAATPRAPVAPGRVAWRKDRDAARAAARASGRPVLVFQMLGDLDDEYC